MNAPIKLLAVDNVSKTSMQRKTSYTAIGSVIFLEPCDEFNILMYWCAYAKIHLKENKDMRTTITINDKLFRALKVRAAETDESISQFVEDAVKYQVLEDFEDLEAVAKREHEPAYSFEDLVKQFKAEGLL